MTISGLLDLGYRSVNAPEAYADTKGVFTTGGSATTAILLQGTEDLGGGLKATFRYEINPDLTGGTGLTGTGQSIANNVTYTGANTSANGYNFVGLESANLGGLKIGRLNTGTLSAWLTGSVFGTAIGSGYGSSGQYARYGATASTFWNTAPTRFNNAIEYSTPKISGFTGRLLFVPKVDQSSTADTTGISSSLTSISGVQSIATNASAGGAINAGVNRAGVTDLSLAYNQGPLNVIVAQQKVKIGTNGISALVGVGPAATTNTTHTLNTVAANYTVGAARIMGAMWTEKQNTTPAVDVSGYVLGANYDLGTVELKASIGATNDKSAANVDRKILGLGADYKLSKRSALWARYENRDANKNLGDDVSAAGTTKTFAVGVRHTF